MKLQLLPVLGTLALLSLADTISVKDSYGDQDPSAKTFGVSKTIQPLGTSNTDFMVDLKARFDVGAMYELPWYTQEQYYIGR